MRPLSRHLRLALALAFAGFAALAFSGCAGEPSLVSKVVLMNSTRSSASISDIRPDSGSVSGGRVTITGANLQKVASITIGGQAATVTQTSTDKMVATVPAAQSFKAGSVPIVITDTGGQEVKSSDETYDYIVRTPVDKQLSYAMTYWKHYNSGTWGDLNPVGGDCANFVSQTLIARGWQMNSQWYNHDAAADWSPAWGYVPAMDNYFSENAAKLGLTKYSFDQRDKIKVGDIVMFDWNDNGSLDHVQIVSAVEKVNGQIRIKMVGHNEDSDYRDLEEAITVDHPGGTGHFWSLST